MRLVTLDGYVVQIVLIIKHIDYQFDQWNESFPEVVLFGMARYDEQLSHPLAAV